jgi:hypothetical protein
MAKKQKRSVSSSARAESGTVNSVSTFKPSGSRSLSVEFNPDYSYVKKDLKQIGILAVSFISILVVLSFFLR